MEGVIYIVMTDLSFSMAEKTQYCKATFLQLKNKTIMYNSFTYYILIIMNIILLVLIIRSLYFLTIFIQFSSSSL